MERKLATIATILDLRPIEGADAIEVATIRGWSVVVKKGEFKVGDMCVYCEIDSVMPPRPEFEFLAVRHYRVRTIKLRGQVSQGICFSISLLSIPWSGSGDSKQFGLDIVEGADVTEMLGITKFEPPIPAQLQGLVKGHFPSFIQKTDEERVQNIPWVLERHLGKMFYLTEKLDGCSATFFVRDGEFGVCSRNMELKETPENSFWKVARQLDLETKMKSASRNFALQGELIGEGIQGNKYGIKGQTVRFYSMFDIDKFEYEPIYRLQEFLGNNKLDMVPIITYNFTFFGDGSGVEAILKMVEGKSALNPKQEREGIVFREQSAAKDADIPGGYLSFKAISNKYLLKEGE
jgi:RNA ligase (TIGR02306 family)